LRLQQKSFDNDSRAEKGGGEEVTETETVKAPADEHSTLKMFER
tara:strand:+ start:307 stop:438 length:132 start_codon:yes stop_codon:yes gene_type:complete